ncbi:DNA-processing protein DprA [Microbacterium sp. p3-SID336]|uniref:DNA-processing protein DprA n=1 Tax=Microbacterium sp. p3-SID336 TaxID=2916212 RepID=UPI0021A70A40|nr:DNA-processing protein DprA [Microbacterium sp. p3-SID336]MCT1477072.1 DNA-processing protein DprA [Microbacterium sp. p3-SID336]
MIRALLRNTDLVEITRRMRGGQEENLSDVVARVAWTVIAEPGDAVAGVLLQEFGAVDALRYALEGAGGAPSPEVRSAGAVRALAEARRRWKPRADPAAVLRALIDAERVGAQLLVPGDAFWPDSLADLGAGAPSALWVRGRAELLAAPARVSVVGARAASGYGERVASDLAGDLAAAGIVVVSGGAYGIDGVAHRAALGVGGDTVAFLAGGVDRAYPAGHQELLRRIAVEGAVVSEPPCGAAPTRWRFLARNRLIAALGAATVVVEAGWRSGSLNTAGHAATLGRPLGAVPGPVTSASSAGCHRLLREYGAVCVTSVADVKELLGFADASEHSAAGAGADGERVLAAMSGRVSRSPREIAKRAGLPPDRVRSLLGLLALEGWVMQDGPDWRRVRARAHER